jgi:hypothetical protein
MAHTTDHRDATIYDSEKRTDRVQQVFLDTSQPNKPILDDASDRNHDYKTTDRLL